MSSLAHHSPTAPCGLTPSLMPPHSPCLPGLVGIWLCNSRPSSGLHMSVMHSLFHLINLYLVLTHMPFYVLSKYIYFFEQLNFVLISQSLSNFHFFLKFSLSLLPPQDSAVFKQQLLLARAIAILLITA